MTCSCISSTLRRSQRPREKSLPLTLTLTNYCTASSAVCTPGTRVCSMLSASSVWKRDLRQFMQATRKHATSLVAITIQAISVPARSPVAMSPRETSNRTSHEREKTFLFTANTRMRKQEEQRQVVSRKDGATETQHVRTIATRTPRKRFTRQHYASPSRKRS